MHKMGGPPAIELEPNFHLFTYAVFWAIRQCEWGARTVYVIFEIKSLCLGNIQ